MWTIRLRLATAVLFPTLRTLAWELSSRLGNTRWLVQTLSWLLKALAEQPCVGFNSVGRAYAERPPARPWRCGYIPAPANLK